MFDAATRAAVAAMPCMKIEPVLLPAEPRIDVSEAMIRAATASLIVRRLKRRAFPNGPYVRLAPEASKTT